MHATEELGMNYINFGRNGSSVAYDRTADGFGPAMTERYKEMPDTADFVVVIAGHNGSRQACLSRDGAPP